MAPNALNRDSSMQKPDQSRTTDISYIPTRKGRLYLAVVMDLRPPALQCLAERDLRRQNERGLRRNEGRLRAGVPDRIR